MKVTCLCTFLRCTGCQGRAISQYSQKLHRTFRFVLVHYFKFLNKPYQFIAIIWVVMSIFFTNQVRSRRKRKTHNIQSGLFFIAFFPSPEFFLKFSRFSLSDPLISQFSQFIFKSFNPVFPSSDPFLCPRSTTVSGRVIRQRQANVYRC